MSPVAVVHRSGPSPGLKADIPRRPSPWHEIAHSLSETALPTRRLSAVGAGAVAAPSTALAANASGSNGTANTPPLSMITHQTPLASDPNDTGTLPSPALSSSALREWDRLLSSSSDVKRHQLVHPSTSPHLRHANSTPSLASHDSPGPPKLAAERDKDGHIEYKLKLIDPTPERFDKLVTQMLWRLKQGRNEAIYELGLADDGTVVGLTRSEMDASLRTLELMASEVGATVIILREVVLVGGPAHPSARYTPALSPSISSSALSASNDSSIIQPAANAKEGTWAWPVVRPDLDANGQPRAAVMDAKKWRGRARRERRTAERERQREERRQSACTRGEMADSANGSHGDDTDIDVPPFHLDMDDPPNPSAPDSQSPLDPTLVTPWKRDPVHDWEIQRKGRRYRGQRAHPESQLTQGDPYAPLPFTHILPRGEKIQRAQNEQDVKKMSAKAVKAAARREQRRLDLYRGDGTGELWLDMESANREGEGRDREAGAELAEELKGGGSPAGMIVDLSGSSGVRRKNSVDGLSNASKHITTGSGTPPACIPVLHPYQPARPSSLRLATPAPATASLISPRTDSNVLDVGYVEVEATDDPFLAELLLLPLDNLSLSFAEVRTVTDPYELYSNDGRCHADTRSHDGNEVDDDAYGEIEETTTFAPSPLIAPAQCAQRLSISEQNGAEALLAMTPNGPEMICVEALVVRKTAEGVAGVEDWCGGGEDAWGFGYGYGDEEVGDEGDELVGADAEGGTGGGKRVQRVEVDDDDPWGF